MNNHIKLKDCECDGWKIYMNQIITISQLFANIHRIQYKGRQFKYCPWCGKELEVDNDIK